MNSGLDHPFPHRGEEVWEEYALGMRSQDHKAMEEHLLLCPACQDLLAAADEFIRVSKAAAALLERDQKRASKGQVTAA